MVGGGGGRWEGGGDKGLILTLPIVKDKIIV